MNAPSVPGLVQATLDTIEVLDRLGVAYAIGGSLASSAHGHARSTMDADLVVDLSGERIQAFLAGLGEGFYADEDRAISAVRRGGSFNVIHLASMSKIDLFVAGDDFAAQRQLARSSPLPMPGAPEVSVEVSSPEDVIGQKLRWYRLGNEVSERQWMDARGVVQAQGDRLDRGYLSHLAQHLGVEDLLADLLD